MQHLANKFSSYSGFFLRLGLGYLYLYSGYSKLFLGDNAIGVCSNRGEAVALVGNYPWIPIDPAEFVIYQSIAEILLGVVLCLGLKTRWAALISVVIFILFFIFIPYSLIWKNGSLLAMSLALVLTKEQRWSLDSLFTKKLN